MLTEEERRRFAEWLILEAENDEQLISVMEALPETPLYTALIRERKIDSAAKRRIASQLAETEGIE